MARCPFPNGQNRSMTRLVISGCPSRSNPHSSTNCSLGWTALRRPNCGRPFNASGGTPFANSRRVSGALLPLRGFLPTSPVSSSPVRSPNFWIRRDPT